MNEPAKRLQKNIIHSFIGLLTILGMTSVLFCTTTFAAESGDHAQALSPEIQKIQMDGLKFGLIAAAVAFGLGAIGAGIAIAHVGAAAMGAVAEKPQIAGQALIFVALAEGIVIFGFITALMIMGKVG